MASNPSKRSVGAVAKDARDQIGEAADDVVNGSSVSTDNVKSRVGSAVDAAGDLYADAASHTTGFGADLPASLSDLSAATEQWALQGRERLYRGVRKQPVEALLLAGAIGYLVGWASSRG